jgi:hypothetical protein
MMLTAANKEENKLNFKEGIVSALKFLNTGVSNHFKFVIFVRQIM